MLGLCFPLHTCHISPQVITAPTEQNGMYKQQRDEYMEHVCDMALRKVSVVTIFGPLTNGTMKIDHYHMGECED